MKCAVYGSQGHYGYIREAAALDPSIEVAGIAGAAEDDLEPLIKAFPGAAVYPDLETLLRKTRPDVLGVAPAFYRAAGASVYAMENGVDVFSEKPLAVNEKELRELIAVWKRTGRELAAMFGIAFEPWYLTMKKAVADGLVGDIRLLHGQKSYKLGMRPDFFREREKSGGLIPWVAIHALDWALDFAGEPESVSAVHSSRCNHGYGDLEISAAVLLRFKSGAAATVTADYCRPAGSARHDDDRLRITGTKGTLEAMDGQVFLEDNSPKRALELQSAGNCLIDFLEKRREGKADETARRAFRATCIALAARRAADEGVLVKLTKEEMDITR